MAVRSMQVAVANVEGFQALRETLRVFLVGVAVGAIAGFDAAAPRGL